MSMNLHAIVRGAINTVNPDQTVVLRASTGYTTNAAGKRTPTYAADATVAAQVQALSGRDLQHPDFLNVQGIKRAVYLYGDVQGVVRPNAKGGDLLVFPQDLGGTAQLWLVVAVLETWNPDATGWCKVGVVLQDDAP
jgi:hypothetical protein